MNVESPPQRQPFSCGYMILLALIIGAALFAFVFWRAETWPMRNAQQGSAELERIGRDVRDAFVAVAQLQPRVTIHNRVYLEQTTAVAELALLSRTTEVEHEFQHTWAGSTKSIKLHGSFNVKAGFDLHRNVSVDVRDNEIVVQVPPASILDVEQKQVDVLEYENGLWNRISAEDVQNELAALPKLAREKAIESGLLTETQAALQKELEQRIGTERPLKILTTPEPATKP